MTLRDTGMLGASAGLVNGAQGLERAVDMLHHVAGCGGGGATVEELLVASGLTRPTLYRLLTNMKSLGLLRQPVSRGRYYLGYELISLGSQAGNSSGLRDLARPALLKLSLQYDDTFFLFIRDGYYALCLEMQDGNQEVDCYSRTVGGRILMGVGQASIALLGGMSREERSKVINHNKHRLARDFQLDIKRVRRQAAKADHYGYAYSAGGKKLEEFTGVAVQIKNSNSEVIGALSCCTTIKLMTRKHRAELISSMFTQASSIGLRSGNLLRVSEKKQ